MNSRIMIPSIILGFVLIGWLAVGSVLRSSYAQTTRALLIQDAQDEYQRQLQAAKDDLDAQYNAAMERYNQEKAAYVSALEDYNTYLSELRDEQEAYEQDFAEQTSNYERAVQEYDTAVINREKAYSEALARAEAAQLRSGITFDVNIRHGMPENDHVGNEWSYASYVNGSEIRRGELTLKLGSTISFRSVATENDTTPDVGSNTGSYTPDMDEFQNGFEFTHNVTVRENKGRYAGNTARITFTYSFSPKPFSVAVNEDELPSLPEKPVQPVYQPPQSKQSKPTEPMEPVRPDYSSISLTEPDYNNITASIDDIKSRNPSYTVISSVISLAALAVSLIPVKLIISEWSLIRKRRKEEYILNLKTDFESRIPRRSKPDFTPPITEFSCEEERRINCRYWKFLIVEQIYQDTIRCKEGLSALLSHEYLKYDSDRLHALDSDVDRISNEILLLANKIESMSNPLFHLPAVYVH